MTARVQELFLNEVSQEPRKKGSHGWLTDHQKTLADVSLKAQIPARGQRTTCQLFQKEVTSQPA